MRLETRSKRSDDEIEELPLCGNSSKTIKVCKKLTLDLKQKLVDVFEEFATLPPGLC